MKLLTAFFTAALAGLAADPDAKMQLKRECITCHSLRIVESQHLSPAAWSKEIDKMAGWGAMVSNKQTLLDYLSSEYGTSKPAVATELSKDGVTKNK